MWVFLINNLSSPKGLLPFSKAAGTKFAWYLNQPWSPLKHRFWAPSPLLSSQYIWVEVWESVILFYFLTSEGDSDDQEALRTTVLGNEWIAVCIFVSILPGPPVCLLSLSSFSAPGCGPWAPCSLSLLNEAGSGGTSHTTVCISLASSKAVQTLSAFIVVTVARYCFHFYPCLFRFPFYLHKSFKGQTHSDFFCFLTTEVRFIDTQHLDDKRLLSRVSCYSSPFPCPAFKKCHYSH